MAIVFLDTEFTSLDQNFPSLISMGLVDETGSREFYAELPETGWQARLSPWAQQHVVPQLNGGTCVVEPATLATRLHDWFADFAAPVQIVCVTPKYDFEFLKEVLSDCWPNNLSLESNWFYSVSLDCGTQEQLEQVWVEHFSSAPNHHALHDAKMLRSLWQNARLPDFVKYADNARFALRVD